MGTRVNDSGVFANGSQPFSETPVSSQDMFITFLLGSVLAMMFLVGTAGNVYTLVLMNIAIRVTGTMYVYIVNLALADLLYLCTIPFVVCTYFARDWYFGDIGCRVLFSLDFLTMQASIFMLTVMSTERYVAVLKPLDTFTRSRHYRRAVTCIVWLVSFALSLPTMIMIELRTSLQDGVEKRMCHPTWQMTAYQSLPDRPLQHVHLGSRMCHRLPLSQVSQNLLDVSNRQVFHL
ncbi:Urotensin-2 receptor [Bagarius yarrelli]|uniref:Urotensin-2 receptor n=1 Tax=Bagarius yarrelli TaxID=175774 RepID=A0A556TP52_BAGYA|nr:Urotensin-2 receptor [Bagarius yarrelli]